MHTSAVDRANTTFTSITSRTGLERSRQQAWRGTAKGKGKHYHHGHDANLCPTLFWHGEGAVFFLRCGNELRQQNQQFPSCCALLCLYLFCAEGRERGKGILLSSFLCGVDGRKSMMRQLKYPCFFLIQHLHPHHLRSLSETVIPARVPDMLQSTSTCSDRQNPTLGCAHCLGIDHDQPAWFQQLPSWRRVQYLSRPSRSHEHFGREVII